MGTLDGRYRLDGEIARGGFGAVYRATHIDTNYDVAIKVLHPHLSRDASVRARFKREAELLAQLRDPHIVTTYEFGETREGRLFIAMELLRGESLCDRLSRIGSLGWHRSISIVREVGSALAEAHALGIVHRDLKPANIHLEKWAGGELVKVLDFGIAKLLDHDDNDELTRAGEVLGTIEYMAPEQLTEGAVDARTDIYALGVILFEMLTGTRPFGEVVTPASHVRAMLLQHPPSIGGPIDRVISRCLAPRAKDRYASVGALLAALDALEGDAHATEESTEISSAFLPNAANAVNAAELADEPTWIGTRGSISTHEAMIGTHAACRDVPATTMPQRPRPTPASATMAATPSALSATGLSPVAPPVAPAPIAPLPLYMVPTFDTPPTGLDGAAARGRLAFAMTAPQPSLHEQPLRPIDRPARGSVAPLPAYVWPAMVPPPVQHLAPPAPPPALAVTSAWRRTTMLLAAGITVGVAIASLF